MTRTLLAIALLAASTGARPAAVDDLLADFAARGAGPFTAEAGAARWEQPRPTAAGSARRCADCHGSDLARPGRHVKTGRPIEPLAPSANALRLTERAQIEKWLRRNCAWTFGRDCTAQEKGDLLAWLRQL